MKHFLALIILLVLPMGMIWAAKTPNLYQVDLPVSLQTEDAKSAAIKQGLLQVLTALTGNINIRQNPAINASIQRANNYVQEFSYSPDPNAASHYLIHIKYSVNDINALLKRAGIAFWSENRPLILVWLTVTDPGSGTNLIGNEDPNVTIMQQTAKQYGLPLIFPIMDVADISLVTPEDVKSFSLPVLKEAGKRYSPDAYLIGNIVQEGNTWQSQWQFILGDNQWQLTLSDNTLPQLMAAILKQTSQSLAKHYMAKTKDVTDTWLKLEVNNVSQRSDLGHLMEWLRKIPQVQQAQLSEVDGNIVQIALLVRGSMSDFQQNATIGQRLALRGSEETNKKLIYEWIP